MSALLNSRYPSAPATRCAVFRLGLVSIVAVVLLGSSGCHRAHYRKRADAEAYALVQEKSHHPHWDLPRYWIEIDPRSRMFDPFDPDHPPLPPDDPASHELMHYIDHKKHYPHWHVNGETPTVENANWTEAVPMDENGVLNMSAEQAYYLALVNSRDFQEQFETLYLSALDVSTERFRYDTQFFGGFDGIYNFQGDLLPPTIGFNNDFRRFFVTPAQPTAETNRLTVGRATSGAPVATVSKRFATAGELVVNFANAFVWEFTGSDVNLASSLLNVSLVQPLLRQAGRDVELERLTIVERNLLANVRQMERFRRGFFVEIITGTNAGNGATRRGGVFGAGLEGFTGFGGGFGAVGGGGGGAGGGTFGGGGAGAADVGGFMGLLQNLQGIRNQQVTIVGLRRNLRNLRESLRESLATIPDDAETIIRTRLQIAQARQSLLNSESQLLNSQADYHATLDGYKITLGLPPQLCVNVDDPMIDQFNLIDPGILSVQGSVTALRDEVGAVNEQILAAAESVEVNGQPRSALSWNDQLAARLTQLKTQVERIDAGIEQAVSTNVVRARNDIERLKEAIPKRRRDLEKLRELYEFEEDRFAEYGDLDPCQVSLIADIDPEVFNVQRLDKVPVELSSEVERLAQKLEAYRQPLQEIATYLELLLTAPEKPAATELYAALEGQVIFAVPSILSDLSDDLLDLSLVQARARTDTVDLSPVDLKWDMALELARQYRRDWMNARAALVDVWRLIEFNADNLESSIDVVFNGDIRTAENNPLSFDGDTARITAGFRFDAPFTRLQERNTYRQALIEYQQSKRDYYAFVDGITFTLRSTLRTLDRNRVNFEERRIAVLSAIEQVVLNDQITKLREERGLESGVTAARDVVDALASLQNAQDTFLAVWLNYEAQRLSLDWNLGTMNLDPDGYWIDPGPIGPEDGYPTPDGMGAPAELIFAPSIEPQPLPDVDPESGQLMPPAPPVELLGDPSAGTATLRRFPSVADIQQFSRLPTSSAEGVETGEIRQVGF